MHPSLICSAKMIVKVQGPRGVSMKPRIPTTTTGAVSTMVTASANFLLVHLGTCPTDLPHGVGHGALEPRKAVRWTGLEGSSLGKLFMSLQRRQLSFRGKKPREPCLGVENFPRDIPPWNAAGRAFLLFFYRATFFTFIWYIM